jgi:hypothetical protein
MQENDTDTDGSATMILIYQELLLPLLEKGYNAFNQWEIFTANDNIEINF